MRTSTGNKIWKLLRAARGRENAIHAHQIAASLGLRRSHERTIRRIISSESDLWPEPVCSLPAVGFFVPADLDEAAGHVAWLDRIAHVARHKARAVRAHYTTAGIHLPSTPNQTKK